MTFGVVASSHPIAFSPAVVAGLVGWWDASNLGGLSDGDTVTSFTDRSASGYDLVVDTGTPSYETSEINSLAAVQYGPGGERHAVDIADGNEPDLTGAFYMACVFELDSVPTTGPAQVLFDKGDQSQYQLGVFRQRPLVYVQGGTAVLESSPGSVTSAGTAYLLTAHRDASDAVTLRLNGTTVASGTRSGSSGGAFRMRMGDSTAGGNPLNGKIGEVLLYDADVSSSDRSNIDSYLADKWGVSI